MNNETLDPPVTSQSPEPFSIWPKPRELAAVVGLIARLMGLYAVLLVLVVGLFGLIDLLEGAPAYD